MNQQINCLNNRITVTLAEEIFCPKCENKKYQEVKDSKVFIMLEFLFAFVLIIPMFLFI
jgi:hypothetical protein